MKQMSKAKQNNKNIQNINEEKRIVCDERASTSKMHKTRVFNQCGDGISRQVESLYDNGFIVGR